MHIEKRVIIKYYINLHTHGIKAQAIDWYTLLPYENNKKHNYLLCEH